MKTHEISRLIVKPEIIAARKRHFVYRPYYYPEAFRHIADARKYASQFPDATIKTFKLSEMVTI
jgi:hypothetical protein